MSEGSFCTNCLFWDEEEIDSGGRAYCPKITPIGAKTYQIRTRGDFTCPKHEPKLPTSNHIATK